MAMNIHDKSSLNHVLATQCELFLANRTNELIFARLKMWLVSETEEQLIKALFTSPRITLSSFSSSQPQMSLLQLDKARVLWSPV